MTVFLTLRLGNPSLQCMCKNEHTYTLTFGLQPEDIVINIIRTTTTTANNNNNNNNNNNHTNNNNNNNNKRL